MRVFVAIEVPGEVAARVDRRVRALRDRYGELRWARAEGWHLTLAFLGEVEPDAMEGVITAVERGVAEVAVERVSLRLGRAGHFNRRVLWLGVDDEPGGAVSRLGAAIQRSVVAAGLPCDEKQVHPHLTLARTRGRRRLPRTVVDDVPDVTAEWTVAAAHVLRSHLGGGGARYEQLAEVPLAP